MTGTETVESTLIGPEYKTVDLRDLDCRSRYNWSVMVF